MEKKGELIEEKNEGGGGLNLLKEFLETCTIITLNITLQISFNKFTVRISAVHNNSQHLRLCARWSSD